MSIFQFKRKGKSYRYRMLDLINRADKFALLINQNQGKKLDLFALEKSCKVLANSLRELDRGWIPGRLSQRFSRLMVYRLWQFWILDDLLTIGT